MKKITTFIFISTLFTSCFVSKSDNDDLQNENDNLKATVENLLDENAKLKRQLEENDEPETVKSNFTKSDERSTRTKFWDDSIAEKLLKDYYDFYNRDYVYRNSKVKRIDDNTFKISLEECINKDSFKENNTFWNASVLTLEIKDDGSYEMKRYVNDM